MHLNGNLKYSDTCRLERHWLETGSRRVDTTDLHSRITISTENWHISVRIITIFDSIQLTFQLLHLCPDLWTLDKSQNSYPRLENTKIYSDGVFSTCSIFSIQSTDKLAIFVNIRLVNMIMQLVAVIDTKLFIKFIFNLVPGLSANHQNTAPSFKTACETKLCPNLLRYWHGLETIDKTPWWK